MMDQLLSQEEQDLIDEEGLWAVKQGFETVTTDLENATQGLENVFKKYETAQEDLTQAALVVAKGLKELEGFKENSVTMIKETLTIGSKELAERTSQSFIILLEKNLDKIKQDIRGLSSALEDLHRKWRYRNYRYIVAVMTLCCAVVGGASYWSKQEIRKTLETNLVDYVTAGNILKQVWPHLSQAEKEKIAKYLWKN